MRVPPSSACRGACAPLPRALVAASLSTLGALSLACDRGTLVTLGDRASDAALDAGDGAVGGSSGGSFGFGTPQVVAGLSSPLRDDNPTLTDDLLEIYFTSTRDGGSPDIWVATRLSATAAFGAPVRVAEIDSPTTYDASDAISGDGLSLWFGSDRAGGMGLFTDVWLTTRATRTAAWSLPVVITALNSPAADVPRPVGDHGLVMPIGSQRGTGGLYRTYFARRATPADPFGAPQMVPGLEALIGTVQDGFLTDDGLHLFYSTATLPGGVVSDLFVASRPDVSAPFATFESLTDLNTPADERDPFLSADGGTFFFSSDRSGDMEIYFVPVTRRP